MCHHRTAIWMAGGVNVVHKEVNSQSRWVKEVRWGPGVVGWLEGLQLEPVGSTA